MNELGARQEPFLFVVDFEMKDSIILPVHQIDDYGILYDINQHTNCRARATSQEQFAFTKQPVAFDEYRCAFDKVFEHLHEGNTYLVNLTFPTHIECGLTLEEIFHRSSAKYRLLFRDLFVVFSPEIFVQIRDGIISSFPMKGTIDAGIEDAEKRILNDPKELAEHSTVVDLIRNDLNSVAKQVRVEQFRYIDHIRTNMKELLQVSSRITGIFPAIGNRMSAPFCSLFFRQDRSAVRRKRKLSRSSRLLRSAGAVTTPALPGILMVRISIAVY